MGITKTKEEFMQELLIRFPNNNVEILEYSGASKPIKYKCCDCEKVYYKSRANHIYENKTLCQICYTSRNSEVRNKFINALKNSSFEAISEIGAISHEVTLKCKKCGHEFNILQYNFINAQRECPHCGKYGNKTKEDFIFRMSERAEEYEILEYINFTHKVKLKHKCGFEFTQLPCNFIKGRGCPKCYGKISKGEQKIIRWLEDNDIEYEHQKKFKETGLKSFDFFIPSQNILIEYQGEQHYHPLNCFGGEEKFKIQQQRDLEKKQFCIDNNYTLIEIPYYEKDIIQFLLPLKGSTTIP